MAPFYGRLEKTETGLPI